MTEKLIYQIQKHDRTVVEKVFERLKQEPSIKIVAKEFDLSQRTVENWARALKEGRKFLFKTTLPDRPIKELIEEEDKIVYYKDKYNELLTRYNARTKESSQMRALIEAIQGVTPTRPRIPVPVLPSPQKGTEIESAVLCLGCLHYGEIVDERETGGISIYNPRIMERRFHYTIDKAIHIAKNILAPGYEIRKLYVFGLGDFISGMIHKELEVTNETGIVGQVLDCVDIVEAGILKLVQAFPKVHFTGIVGNHGRVEPKRYFKMKAVNNYDYMIYKFLEKTLAKQSNLTFNIPESYWAIEEVEGRRFLLIHGDSIRSWMGLPFYSLVREYLKWRALAESYVGGFQDLVCGHFHTINKLSVAKDKILVNGSLKGGDEFSLGALSAAADPAQYFFGVSRRKGVTFQYELSSGDIK